MTSARKRKKATRKLLKEGNIILDLLKEFLPPEYAAPIIDYYIKTHRTYRNQWNHRAVCIARPVGTAFYHIAQMLQTPNAKSVYEFMAANHPKFVAICHFLSEEKPMINIDAPNYDKEWHKWQIIRSFFSGAKLMAYHMNDKQCYDTLRARYVKFIKRYEQNQPEELTAAE